MKKIKVHFEPALYSSESQEYRAKEFYRIELAKHNLIPVFVQGGSSDSKESEEEILSQIKDLWNASVYEEEQPKHKAGTPFFTLSEYHFTCLLWHESRGYTGDLFSLVDSTQEEDGSDLCFFFSDSSNAYEWLERIEENFESFCACMSENLSSTLIEFWTECSDFYV